MATFTKDGVTGGQVLAEELGLKLENVTITDLGRAKRFTMDKDTSTIVDGAGDKTKIQARIGEIPAKVVRTALQNAASVASLMLTTQCLIAERRSDEKAAAGGGHEGHGHGGF